jgi:multidrug efflux pump subunit AcrA (membrane-fusion protein)
MQPLASFIAFLLCTLILCGCTSAQSNPAAGGMPPAMVKTSIIGAHELPETSTFVGVIKSRQSVSLRPMVAGRVTQIFARSGDQVKAGAPLIQLDQAKQEAVVSNASAQTESWLAEQENARAMEKSLDASKVSKQANLEFATKQYGRYKQLNDQGAVSAEQVDNWRNQMNVARADLDAVEAQIRAQKAVEAKDAKLLMQAKASGKEQTEQLRYFTVRAPFAGQVGDIPVRVGDYVTTDTLLTSVDQLHPLELYVNVPTTESRHLRKGLMVQVLNDDGTVDEQGELFFVGAQVNAMDQTVLAKAQLANSKETLRSGQDVKVRMVWNYSQTLTVPVTAVTRFTGQDFVFVAETNKEGKLCAKQKAVRLGAIEGNEYRVVSGLKDGDEVVTSGTQTLSDGAPIKTST